MWPRISNYSKASVRLSLSSHGVLRQNGLMIARGGVFDENVSDKKITGLYDRRNDDISVGEVERIGI
jgi:hypothetical protein